MICKLPMLLGVFIFSVTVGYASFGATSDYSEMTSHKSSGKKPKPGKHKKGKPHRGYTGRLVPGEWKEAWTQTLAESLTTSTLINHQEPQIEKMCPGYNANQNNKRQLFWQQLLIALSWRESLHGPDNYVDFNRGVNDGLFQINPQLRTAYGCGAANLFDPLDNIKCAILMAAKLVDQAGSFLVGPKGGMAAYWQPLRSTSTLNLHNRNFILATVQDTCSSGTLKYLSTDSPAWTSEMLDLEMVTPNTNDDLGLAESQIEPLVQFRDSRKPATYDYDSASKMVIDLSDLE